LAGANKVITMEMLGKIRRMYFRDKKSLHEIAKRTGLVAQHDSQVGQRPGDKQPVYRRRSDANKLSPFTNAGAGAQGRLAPHQANRRTAKALLVQIKAEGMTVATASSPRSSVPGAAGGQGAARLCAVDVRVGRGVPVRLERGRLVVGGIYQAHAGSHI
jgi:hypothetical protein